ncbi:hypothetical protein WDU94_010320 [Cyamophila willieti]
MVCVPCFIIPALLFLWRFLRPYVERFWKPIDQNKEEAASLDNTTAEKNLAGSDIKLPFGITCPTCPIRGPCPNKEIVEDLSSKGKVDKLD